MFQWQVIKRKSNTPKLSTTNHAQDPINLFFPDTLDVHFKYCIILKSEKLTIFKKSMTTIITFKVKILPYARDMGSNCNFLPRNLGHKELKNNKASITIQLFSL